MEFWGVEVKAGQPLKVTPNPGTIIHLSQAALGESKKDKGLESVLLSVKIGSSKIVLGTLSGEKFPQLSFDVVFEKEVELSHNWKNGSVYLCGYQTPMQDDNDTDMFDSEEEEDDLPLMNANNGKVEAKVENAKPAVVNAKPKATFVEPSKAAKADDDSDSDDDSEDDDDDESGEDDSEEGMCVDEDDEDDEDEDDDEDKDEETPKKGKKRVNDSRKKTPMASKKAKADTPQKTGGKKGVHTATPHPAKNAQKNPANGNKQTPKSGGQFSCKPCNRSFASDNALQSHNKAKHSGGK